MSKSLILTPKEALMFGEDRLGGKAKNMAWLSKNGLPVPEWFVLTTDAFKLQMEKDSLNSWIQEQLAQLDDKQNLNDICEIIKKKILSATICSEIKAELEQKLESIPDWQNRLFAVRSSAVGEDNLEASYAGQMDSFLFQKGLDAIVDSIQACFASAFSERVIQYRKQHGLDTEEVEVAVIIQEMVDGRVSGVFFTAHPVTGSRVDGLISACYGIGEGIVSGICSTDEFHVGMYSHGIRSEINEKDCQLIFDGEKGTGTKKEDVSKDKVKASCLTEDEIKRLIDLGVKISERMAYPQDIEWTIRGNDIFILQTRPITSLPAPSEPKGETIVWDNSNIQESYCGVTTPLTYTFARRGYAIAYSQSALLLGVSKKRVEEMDHLFQNMIGLVNGRIYYNINSWYDLLSDLLPFVKNSKADMERMMGLQDPVDLVQDNKLPFIEKLKKIPGAAKALVTLLEKLYNMDTHVQEFRDEFKKDYESIARNRLHTFEVSELQEMLNFVRDKVGGNYRTPIINDIYVMVMNGKVFRWLERSGVENPLLVQNNLMSGEEGIESTEPTKTLLRMCQDIRKSPALAEAFQTNENEHLLSIIQVIDKDFYNKCLQYIDLYGDRCIGELKLESISLRQDSSFMFAVLKNYLSREDLTVENLAENEMAFRLKAEEEAFTKVESKFGSRGLKKFRKHLVMLRNAVKNRENMRLVRTRIFGLCRSLYLEMGNQLAFYGLIEEQRDIFYLTVEETEAYVEGRSVQTDLKSLIAIRKEEFDAWEEKEIPHHFTTKGPVYHHNSYEYKGEHQAVTPGDLLQGTGCYPGIAENKVKLISSPKDELSLDGQILCTLRTDPGWAPLFPTAGGIIVERGSTLSHAAVVARELGIPAIVNIPGITDVLKSGELIRIDGAKGTIERLSEED